MNQVKLNISQSTAAKIAGYGLLAMTLLVIYPLFMVIPDIMVHGDAAATMANLKVFEFEFRMSVSILVIVIILDIVVAWALYELFKNISKGLSLLTAWFRLVYSAVFALALGHYLNALQLVSDADFLRDLNPSLLQSNLMLSLNAYTDTWGVGYIFFGLHLALLGYLVYRSGFIPRLIGVLVGLAGFSYIIDYFSKLLMPAGPLTLSMALAWGELILMFWLIFKNGKMSNQQEY